MLQRLKPDEPKRVPAECVCPTGAETASRVAGVCCLITSAAMMTQCSPANVLAWVNRIFTDIRMGGHDGSGSNDGKLHETCTLSPRGWERASAYHIDASNGKTQQSS